MEMSVPLDLRDLSRFALLLDIDGTLLEIAPTPQAVRVPPRLCETLAALRERTGGALALVSGRLISDIDILFKPLRLPAVGGHGAELRAHGKGDTTDQRAYELEAGLRSELAAIAKRHEGVLFEDKGSSIALHYRTAPKQGLGLVHDVKHAFAAWNDPSIELLAGKAVLEIKHRGYNKGTGVRELMSFAPFNGRRPIYVGDDKTDEFAFAVMPEFDGICVSVGRRISWVEHCIDSPASVRAWLDQLSVEAAVS
jgi:trehalose 6-phosphate phosphatase